MRKTGLRAAGIALAAGIAVLSAGADEASLTGVDARLMGVTGSVHLYVVAADDDGMLMENLEEGDFIVRDAPAGENLGEPVDIRGFSRAGERRDGISFLMLIDDSGSMYDGPDGRPSPSWEQSRAAMARREATRFLDELEVSMDRAGLAVFGTRYRVLAGPRNDRSSLIERLGVSAAPETEDAYTELYGAIAESAGSMQGQKGRRIVILFSDGENYPYAERTGNPHPDYGMDEWMPDDALEALREEAVTLYAVRFGANRDDDLARIAQATGGLVFDVDGEDELTGLYGIIRERVAAEYRLTYRPHPTGAASTRVTVELASGTEPAELEYPSMFVFGAPSDRKTALLSLLVIPAAAMILLILARMKAASAATVPSLDRLRPVGGGEATVALSPGKTVISAGVAGAATTILPAGKGAQPPGTILVEKGRDGKWRASADGGVTVNNRRSDATVLENGDVIRAGEELIVFDDGES